MSRKASLAAEAIAAEAGNQENPDNPAAAVVSTEDAVSTSTAIAIAVAVTSAAMIIVAEEKQDDNPNPAVASTTTSVVAGAYTIVGASTVCSS